MKIVTNIKNKLQRAYTLIELLVVIAIIIIVGVIALAVIAGIITLIVWAV